MKKKLIYILLALITSSCTLNKVDNVHGTSNLKNKSQLIKINETNKNDIVKILGPSIIFDDKEKRWTYFEVRETRTKYGRKNIYVNDYIEIYFNDYGIAKKIDFYDLKTMRKIKFSDDKTISLAIPESFSKELLNSTRKRMENARDKFNGQ